MGNKLFLHSSVCKNKFFLLVLRTNCIVLYGMTLNSITAIDGHDRQYFNELRARVVSPRIFVCLQSLIAR